MRRTKLSYSRVSPKGSAIGKGVELKASGIESDYKTCVMPSVLGRLLANLRPTTKAPLGKKRWGTEVGHDDSRPPKQQQQCLKRNPPPLCLSTGNSLLCL